jgi:hypothetical protein
LFLVRDGPLKNGLQIIGTQRLKHQNPAPGEKGRNNVERGIFGGRADEGQQAAFHVGEKGILLAFVETMDFIHENNGGGVALILGDLGLGHYFPDLLDPGQHRGKERKISAGGSGENPGQGGFAGAGRAPEQQGREVFLVDEPAEQLVFAQQLFLSDKLIYCLRAQAFCQGGCVWSGRLSGHDSFLGYWKGLYETFRENTMTGIGAKVIS